MELAVDVVVEGGFKFASPGVEAEVEEMAGLWGGGVGGEEGYEGVVACPGVVGGYAVVCDAGETVLVEVVAEKAFYFLGLGGDDPELLALGDLACYVDVALGDFLYDGLPVCPVVGPCELYGFLGLPFCW